MKLNEKIMLNEIYKIEVCIEAGDPAVHSLLSSGLIPEELVVRLAYAKLFKEHNVTVNHYVWHDGAMEESYFLLYDFTHEVVYKKIKEVAKSFSHKFNKKKLIRRNKHGVYRFLEIKVEE